jgi:hypothetical protein
MSAALSRAFLSLLLCLCLDHPDCLGAALSGIDAAVGTIVGGAALDSRLGTGAALVLIAACIDDSRKPAGKPAR